MLSERQTQVAQLIAQALPDKEIAARLGISTSVVKHHAKRIYRILEIPIGSNRRVALALKLRSNHAESTVRLSS